MEEWKRHYEHDRDVQVAYYESLGLPIPEETQYGVLKRVPGLIREFNGKTFWPAFKKRNHNSVIFKECQCYNAPVV